MHLPALREELRGVLSTNATQRIFDNAKRHHPGLASFSTVFAVLAVLEDPAVAGYAAQEQILRALVAEMQRVPGHRLWQTLLFYAFLPSLIKLRARTRGGRENSKELDSTACMAFCQVLASYPLTRRGSIAAGLTRDVAKLYFRLLQEEQHRLAAERELVAYARRAHELLKTSEPVAVGFDFAAHLAPLDEEPDVEELEAMHELLTRTLGERRGGTIDADLVWATRIQGMNVREFLSSRGMETGTLETDRRLESCLWRRRLRAEEALYEALRGCSRKKRSRCCPVSSRGGFSKVRENKRRQVR